MASIKNFKMGDDAVKGLKKRVEKLEKLEAKLEKKIEDGRREDRLRVLEIEKEDILVRDMKSYENNIKVVGFKYEKADAQSRDDKGREKWRATLLQKILVDTKLVKSESSVQSKQRDKRGSP